MPINLEVGKTYLNRRGSEVVIQSLLDQNVFTQMYANGFRFLDTNNFAYQADGRWCVGNHSESRYDLVSEASGGESLGDILADALKERDKKARDTLTRITNSHDEIVRELGYMAAKGLTIRCVKIYRAIYGTSLIDAKTVIEEAAATARRLYHFG